MSPKLVFDLIQGLTAEQRAAVVQIGFGGLLNLKINNTFGELMKYLIDKFDINRCAVKLEVDELIIEEDDIECTLGIPRGPKPVREASKYEEHMNPGEPNEYAAVLGLWRERWGIVSASPITTAMPAEILKREDHGDMFKRDFVVLIVSSLLRGHQHRTCNYRILKSLMNVGEIKDYNWCAYTYECLVPSIQSFKKNPTGFFSGPVAFLLLVYFDRVQFRGMRVERKYPTLIGWTTAIAKKRIAAEKKAGGFGKGKVVQRIHKPAVDAATTSSHNVDPPAAAEPRLTVPPSSVDRVAHVLKKIASDVREFGEVMADIGRQGAPIGVMKKTFSALSDMINVASTIETPSTPTPSQLDDIFFGSESFTAAVDDLVEAFNKTRKQMDPDAPSFDLGLPPTPPLSQQQQHQSPPPSNQQEQHLDTEIDAGQPDVDALVDRIGRDAGVSTSNPQEQTPAVIKVPFARAASPPANVDEFDGALAESESDVEDVTVRRRPARKFKNIPLYLRSPYWNEHGMHIHNATNKEKFMSNYAFMPASTEHPIDELLFSFNDYFLTRHHFTTLSNGEVDSEILNVWSLRLSLLDARRAVGQPKRVFFSTLAYLQLDPMDEWMKSQPEQVKKKNFYDRMHYEISNLHNLDITDSDLIFFPILRHAHYFVVCINIKASTIQIIDNKSLPDGVSKEDKYGNCTTILLTTLKEYLASETCELFWKLDELDEEVVEMPWKETENYIDCGIYVMRHMETFKGTLTKWNPGFKRRATLNEHFICGLRAKYAAAIIMWKANTVRENVIKSAKELFKKKLTI